uniref:Uncharacterized protein n=1 Tax=Rhizophora mucronata TaxID=61149 RepID=A0A2P2NL37_RHIMU
MRFPFLGLWYNKLMMFLGAFDSAALLVL